MAIKAPSLVGGDASCPAQVSLASGARIKFSIPEPNEVSASAQVSIIVGPDPESPEAEGQEKNAGQYDPNKEDYVKESNLKLDIAADDLKKFVNQTVQVRYAINSESGRFYSEPLMITVSQ